ncbi:MAG: hypothetical protein KDB53_02410, partial [Planctomycetes bacterium]|nr:hypothetical protein [Planctomycetota bacterium]
QREDGGIPFEPDVILDLERFRDTTPKAPLRPGFTVPGTERTRAVIRDLDADGIPDYVITHRRKVWVFHGTKLRPQFTRPSHVLKTADEITTVQVVSLDDDDYPDLLLLRVQVPSIGSLITGLLGSFSVDLRASGYANEGGQRFAKDAAWKRELVFDMPSLGEVLRDPESILKRLEDAGSELRETLSGDLDGDGTNDQILVDEATGRFEVWKGVPGVEVKGPTTLDRVLRRVLFEDEKTRWDLDRVIAFIEDLGRSEMSRLTEGRQRVGFWDGRVEGLGDPVQRTVAVSDRGRSWLVLFYPRAGDEPAMVIQSVTVRP